MATIVKRSDIFIADNRQRQEFDPEFISELSSGISMIGLLHAPVVRKVADESGTIKFHLVAGESRLRAIELMEMTGGTLRYNGEVIPPGHVPVTDLGDLDELAAEEAELEENKKRKDLTWQEEAAAMTRLHTLRGKQAAREGRVHTIADTTREVSGRADGRYQTAVKQNLIVAAHLHNPAVAAAKSPEEAFKILKKEEAAREHQKLVETVGKTYTASVHQFYNVNCIDWMKEQPSEQFDCILTDPPYGMGAQDFGDGGGKLVNSEHHYDDSYESWFELMQKWCPEAYRLAKPQAHAYVFCDQANFPSLKVLMEAAGWYVFRTMLIAHKPNSGRVPLPELGPRRQYETILYAIKGKKPTLSIQSDVISTYADANLTHGAQKPVALYVDLLKRSCRPGDAVADFFVGSGTIFAAATELKLVATGTEESAEYYGMALQRLKKLENPGAPLDGAALGTELKDLLGGK